MEFLPALTFPVMILLNLTAADFPVRYRSHFIERAVETAASLVYYFIGLGQDVGLVTSGVLTKEGEFQAIPVRGSYGHAVTLLDLLARIDSGPSEFTGLLFTAGLRIPYGCRVVVVSPPLREDQEEFFEVVRRKGYHVELFQISSTPGRIKSGGGMPVYRIKDYGDELIEEKLVSGV
jgi:uncharacterized protein (DUF58 family)